MSELVPQQIQEQLVSGERVLWSGRPHQGLVFRTMDWFFIPFSLLWGGFAIAFPVLLFTEDAPFPMLAFGVLFGLVGIYVIFGRFILDIAQRRATFYALTTDRAIIVSGLLHQTVRSVVLKNLGELSVTTRRDGTGTITFGQPNPFAWAYPGGGFTMWGTAHYAPTFELVDNVKTVYQRINLPHRTVEK